MRRVESVLNDADGQAEELIDRPHPLGVAASEIIVDGNHMHAAPFERARVNGQRGDQGLAFAGFHLGDAPFVEHLSAHDLHVEVPHPNGAFAGFSDHGEDFGQHGIERLALLETLPELWCFGLQFGVRERGELLVEPVYGTRGATQTRDFSLVAVDYAFEECHGLTLRNDSQSGYSPRRCIEGRHDVVVLRPGAAGKI